MAFIDELMKLQGNQMGRTPVAPFPATPQATPQAPQAPQASVVQGQVEPNFMSKLGSLFGGGSGGGAGLPQAFTPPSAGAVQAQERTDIAPVSLESLGLESPQQRVLQESAASGAIQDPFGVTQAQIEQAGNADFGKGTASPSLVPSGSLGTVPYDPTLPVPQVSQENIAGAQGPLAETIQPTAPTAFQSPSASGLTTAGGQPLAEFLAGGQQLDPQGRMIDPSADRSFFEQQSAAREQRAAAQFGVARGPDARDRDAGGDKPDFRALARAQGAKGSAVNAQAKQLEADYDLKRSAGAETPLEQAQKEATLAKTVQDTEIAASKEERARKAAAAGLNLTPGEQKIDTDAAPDLNDWRMNGSALAQSNMSQLSEVIGDLEDGNIDTRNISDFAPMSDTVRALFNPTGQDALDKVRGVIFQSLKATLGGQFAEKEGVRLVEAAYNPKLKAEQNIDRLGALLRRTQAAAQAKDQMSQYFNEKGTLKGYSGAGARAAFDASTGAQGAKGSPIKGDVDYATEADSRLGNY